MCFSALGMFFLFFICVRSLYMTFISCLFSFVCNIWVVLEEMLILKYTVQQGKGRRAELKVTTVERKKCGDLYYFRVLLRLNKTFLNSCYELR